MKLKIDITRKKPLEIINNNMKPIKIKKKENKDIIKTDFDLLTYN